MNPTVLSFYALLLMLLAPSLLVSQQDDTSIPPVVDSLIQVSRAHTSNAEFDDAFAASARAGVLAKECCGERSVAYASYCFNEGRIRYFMGKNEEAIPWYQQSKELRAELLGTMHMEYSKSLNNMAVAYKKLGEFSLAEPLYLESLKVREHNLGKESAAYATVLYNLAGFYVLTGRYDQAEPMALEAKEIRERVLGVQHADYAASLVGLANIQYNINNYERALGLYLEAKAVYEQQEPLPYYAYTRLLDNLGAAYQRLGDFEQSEGYYTQSAEWWAAALGEENEEYALVLNHLASVYVRTDRFELAEEALSRSLAILEKLGHQLDDDYAYSLQDLGSVYQAQEQFVKAKDFHQRALDIIGLQFQKYHPRYLLGLRSIAQIEIRQRHFAVAAGYLRELAQSEHKTLNNAVRHLSEDELATYSDVFKSNLHQYLSLAEHYPEIGDVCFDKLLIYKGFLQTQALQLQQQARENGLLKDDYLELRDLHLQLGALYTSAGASATQIQELEEAAYTVEKRLVRQNANLGEALQIVSWESVRDQLPEGSAALEFVEYVSGGLSTESERRYAALLVSSNSDFPVFIPLCDAGALEELLSASVGEGASFINSLYGERGAKLYQLIWAPIEAILSTQGDIDQIYYSAGGLLHRLNLQALPNSISGRLTENYHLQPLGSTRQLVFEKPESKKATHANRTAVLYGGISYGTPNTNATVSQELDGAYPKTRGYDPSNGYWQSLAWTEIEVMTAGDLLTEAKFQTTIKIAAEASEDQLKSMAFNAEKSPALLHLATHGFFFPEQDGEESDATDTIIFRDTDNAMIRSGLVLADGNFAWANGRPRQEGQEDGILTAYEVSKMDLGETELVILSACETGLGDIRGTEGVYGLQRAFKIAGAKYLIMTLWQVPDFETQAFMSTFYLAWLDEEKTIPEAFQAAQDYMRARYKEPFKWAGFQLIK